MRAKELLDRKAVAYEEVAIMTNQSLRAEMIRRSNGRTSVPQIFIDDEHIGGSDELFALERTDALDAKLGRQLSPALGDRS